MTDTKSGARKLLDRNPGANRLAEELESYVQARLGKTLDGVGDRIGEAAQKVGESHLGPGALLRGVGKGGKMLVSRITPGTSDITSAVSHAKDTLMDKVSPGGKEGEPRSSASNSGRKNLTIIEDIDVGVPVEEAYDQWTQFQEFSRFAKGVVSVDQQDDTTTQWQVKVAKSNRAFTSTITEQVPDQRIAWTSEGAKGTTRGVVTFHSLGENLTKVLLVMEYYPKGFFEKTGSLVRAQGRRARLDLKAFRTFVMMKGEATGGWRGEIRGGKVVAGPEERDEEEEQDERDEDAEASPAAEDESDEDEEESDAAPEGAEDDQEYEDEDEEYDEDDEDAEGAEDTEDTEDADRYDEEEPEDRYDEDAEEDEGAEDAYGDGADEEEAEDEAPRRRRSRKG